MQIAIILNAIVSHLLHLIVFAVLPVVLLSVAVRIGVGDGHWVHTLVGWCAMVLSIGFCFLGSMFAVMAVFFEIKPPQGISPMMSDAKMYEGIAGAWLFFLALVCGLGWMIFRSIARGAFRRAEMKQGA